MTHQVFPVIQWRWSRNAQQVGLRSNITLQARSRQAGLARLLNQINTVPMGLKTTDFLLTDTELEEVNSYLRAKATAHSRAGEDPPDSVRVMFEFSPVFGRDVSVYFNGAVNGYCITDWRTENHETKA